MTAPGAGRHHRRGPGGSEAAAAALHQLHMDAALRGAEASPTARALLDQARNGTYSRLAPIIAGADPYWAARQQTPPSPPTGPGLSATGGPMPDGREYMPMKDEPSWWVDPEAGAGVPVPEDAARQPLTARIRRVVASAYRRTRRRTP